MPSRATMSPAILRVTSAFSGCEAASAARDGALPSPWGRRMSATRRSGRLENSPMSRPANVTESASRRRRLPPHSGHGVLSMYSETRRFMSALCVVANVWSTWRRALVNVP